MFTGSHVAIVTPFRKGKVDERALGDLIEWQIAKGTNGIVPCGTTGESATLSHEEHNRVIELTVEVVRRRVPVTAGTGSNSTDEAISLTKHAKEAGADAALLITPYYNKPTQEGLYRHYKAIAEAVDLPLVLYNIPGRTGVNMLPATIARLAVIENIVGVKEGSGVIQQASDIVHTCGDRLAVLAGDDAMTLPMMAVGGQGVITVTANIAPTEMANMVKAFAAGNVEEARRIHFQLSPLFAALFYETNPIPVKEALGMMGKIDPELRLPLCPMGKDNRDKLMQVMKEGRFI
ncbi:MAG: 4-hydroxy-tetrahydrodipicolinate synthase [Nitrospira sp.]|jgi:4-hydroxy-tetrahydrodipicolinate synthase|nr:4-hydroxy-tetrahydrodipicolinate synthase [Nitrospira sp.]